MPEFGLTASTESLPLRRDQEPVGHRALGWRVQRRIGGSGGGGVVPMAHANDGGGLDQHPGLLLRPGRAQADTRPAGRLARAGAPPGRHRRAGRAHADRAGHRPLLLRSRAAPPRTRAAAGRAGSRVRTPAGCASGWLSTPSRGFRWRQTPWPPSAPRASCSPSLGHHVDETAPPVPTSSGRTSSATGPSSSFSLKNGGRRVFGPGFDGAPDRGVHAGHEPLPRPRHRAPARSASSVAAAGPRARVGLRDVRRPRLPGPRPRPPRSATSGRTWTSART